MRKAIAQDLWRDMTQVNVKAALPTENCGLYLGMGEGIVGEGGALVKTMTRVELFDKLSYRPHFRYRV